MAFYSLQICLLALYYIPGGEDVPSTYRPLFNFFYLKTNLKFIPYSNIRFAKHSVDKLWGDAVVIHIKDGSILQIRTSPFSAERQEVIALIIAKQTDQSKLN
jgi:hypothetical protein